MIARARHLSKLSSEDFAAALRQDIGRSIPRQSLSSWENAHSMPKADVLLAAAKIAGSTIDGLMGEESMEERLRRLEFRIKEAEAELGKRSRDDAP